MGYLDPELMRVFRGKVCDPRHFPEICRILQSYCYEDLKYPEGAYGMIDRLSNCCGVPVTNEQRDNAADWLMNCNVDPQNPYHQRDMWNLIHSQRDRFWF